MALSWVCTQGFPFSLGPPAFTPPQVQGVQVGTTMPGNTLGILECKVKMLLRVSLIKVF